MPEISQQQQALLDEVFGADMSLADVRAWKQDLADGDKISATDYMKQKQSLSEYERAAAKQKRIAGSKETKDLNEFLNDKFPKPPVKKAAAKK
jgi:hypothetical protein